MFKAIYNKTYPTNINPLVKQVSPITISLDEHFFCLLTIVMFGILCVITLISEIGVSVCYG